MAELLQAEGVDGIADFELVPWGNAYADTAACPGTGEQAGYPLYNVTSRECWNDACLAGDCELDGPFVYQHSPSEGLADVLEACAVDAYFRRAGLPKTGRGDAAAAARTFRGDESRRRRGWR